jgi:hypothetical protein
VRNIDTSRITGDTRERTPPAIDVGRRVVVRRLAGLAAGLFIHGCTPLRMGLQWYPTDFHERRLLERILRAFVTAVIPGAPADGPHLTTVYFDTNYPFARHAAFFAADLCRRSGQRFDTQEFDALPMDRRVQVIQNGMTADAVARRLYAGAVFLAQISFYSGMYDSEQGCSLIGFEGRFRPRPVSGMTYPDAARFLARPRTPDGNPA